MHAIVRTHSYTPVSTAVPARTRPACADEDPQLFFPVSNVGLEALQIIEKAKAVCRRCPLIDSCLQGALERGEDFGVWGGTDEDDRRRIKERSARNRVA